MTGNGRTIAPELPAVTDELLAELGFRYAHPRCCRVCGAELEVASSQGMKMVCTSDGASPLASRYEAAGVTWKEALDHYQASEMYGSPDGDVRVLALIAEVKRLQAQTADPAASVTAGDVIRIVPGAGKERVMIVSHVEQHIILLNEPPGEDEQHG